MKPTFASLTPGHSGSNLLWRVRAALIVAARHLPKVTNPLASSIMVNISPSSGRLRLTRNAPRPHNVTGL